MGNIKVETPATPGDLLAHLRGIPMTEWVWADAEMIFSTLEACARMTDREAIRAEALETVAKIVDPHGFRQWQSMYEYGLRVGDTEEESRQCADWAHGKQKEEALGKAAEIMAFLANAGAVPEGWRPIDSAPKDGTHVVLTSTSPLWHYPLVAFWNPVDAWWEFSEPVMSSNFSVSELVDRWMPLPAAPVADGGKI